MPQIIPIRELKNTNSIAEMCKRADEPIFVTKNGYGEMVVMSMEFYEKLFRQLELYRELAVSERQVAEGKTKNAKAALDDLRTKYDL